MSRLTQVIMGRLVRRQFHRTSTAIHGLPFPSMHFPHGDLICPMGFHGASWDFHGARAFMKRNKYQVRAWYVDNG